MLTESIIQSNVDSDEAVLELSHTSRNTFEVSITNLRMLTNYSFTVRPRYGSFVANLETIPADSPQVFVETKSCKWAQQLH